MEEEDEQEQEQERDQEQEKTEENQGEENKYHEWWSRVELHNKSAPVACGRVGTVFEVTWSF